MNEAIRMLITGVLGTIGFGIIFRCGIRELSCSTAGAAVTILAYLGTMQLTDGHMLASNLIAASAAGLVSAIFARVLRVPSTVLLMPELIPLLPGSSLYYTLSSLIGREYMEAVDYLRDTLEVALGIAIGIVIASMIDHLFLRLFGQTKPKKRKAH